MENNFENTPDNNNQDSGQQPVYTDPNANVTPENAEGTSTEQQSWDQAQNQNQGDQPKYQYTYQQNQSQSQQGQSQNTNYQQYQDQYGNYSYNQNPNYNYNNYNGANPQGYGPNYMQQPQMDTSPMSMGEWLLTILALFIPCAGLIIYFVWAFGKKGNINRRNYCRAMLIIYGALIVIYIIFFAIFGVMIGTSTTYYY